MRATPAHTFTLWGTLTETVLGGLILGEQLSLSAWFGAGVLLCCLVVFAWAQVGDARQQR